jgi:hypothetical protein
MINATFIINPSERPSSTHQKKTRVVTDFRFRKSPAVKQFVMKT